MKDPEALKRKQQKREEMEKKGDQVGGEGGLKVVTSVLYIFNFSMTRFASVP